jgi:hypothetical protein
MARSVRARNPILSRLSQAKTMLSKKKITDADRKSWSEMRQELRMVCADAAKDDEVPLVLALMESLKGRWRIPEKTTDAPAKKRTKRKSASSGV